MADASAAIRQVLQAYTAAVFAKDANAYVALYDDDVRIFDTWERWSYHGTVDWRSSADGWFESLGTERVRVEAEDLRILVADDLATVDGFIRFAAQNTDGVELRSLTERLTWILRFADGHWKIVHQHTSAPLDSKTAKAIFSRARPGQQKSA